MASQNDFDSLINAARDTQQAEAQRLQQIRQQQEEAKAQVLLSRQKTQDMARYAAQLFRERNLVPPVRLSIALPQTYTQTFWGSKPNPISYTTVAEGWPIVQGWHYTGQTDRYGLATYDTQGLLLTRGGDLVQYVGGDETTAEHEPFPHTTEPSGKLVVNQYAPLGSDPLYDSVVVWYSLGSGSPKDGIFAYSKGEDRYSLPNETKYQKHQGCGHFKGPDIEEYIQQSMARLVARLIPN